MSQYKINKSKILFKTRIISVIVLIAFILSGFQSSHALAPWLASQSPIVKREIQAALQRTRIIYAESDEAKSLLEAQHSDALLLPSGKYLVKKEVAEDDIGLVRTIIHEDMEALMQILQRENLYRYNGIKNIVLGNRKIKQLYYDLCHDGEEPVHLSPELMLNDIVAKALEVMFIRENGLTVIEDHEAEDAHNKEERFYTAIKPLITECRHNYFRDGLFISAEDSRIRGKKIQSALNNGFVFHPAARMFAKRNASGEDLIHELRYFPFTDPPYKKIELEMRVSPTARLTIFSNVQRVKIPGYGNEVVKVVVKKITENFFEVSVSDLDTKEQLYCGSYLRYLNDGEKQKNLYTTREHIRLYMYEKIDIAPVSPLPLAPKKGGWTHIFNSLIVSTDKIGIPINSDTETVYARVTKTQKDERFIYVFEKEGEKRRQKSIAAGRFDKEADRFIPLVENEEGVWSTISFIPKIGTTWWLKNVIRGFLVSRKRRTIKSGAHRYHPKRDSTQIYMFLDEKKDNKTVYVVSPFALPADTDVWMNNVPEEPRRVEIRKDPLSGDLDDPDNYRLPFLVVFYNNETGGFRVFENSELKKRSAEWMEPSDKKDEEKPCPDPLLTRISKFGILNMGNLYGKKTVLYADNYKEAHVFVQFKETPEKKKGVYVYLLDDKGVPMGLLRRGYFDEKMKKFKWVDAQRRKPVPLSDPEKQRLEDTLWTLGYKPAPEPVKKWFEYINANSDKLLPSLSSLPGYIPGLDRDGLKNTKSFIKDLVLLVKKSATGPNVEDLIAEAVSTLSIRKRKELIAPLSNGSLYDPRPDEPSQKEHDPVDPFIRAARVIDFYLHATAGLPIAPSVPCEEGSLDSFGDLQSIQKFSAAKTTDQLCSMLNTRDKTSKPAFGNLVILNALEEIPLPHRAAAHVQKAVGKLFNYDSPFVAETFTALGKYFSSILAYVPDKKPKEKGKPLEKESAERAKPRAGTPTSESQYFEAIGQYPLLSRGQELGLAHRIRQGDSASRARFIVSNLRLVIPTAKKYARKTGMPILDLIQEGNEGMIKAVDKFRHEKGYKFSTYAVWWIRQNIAHSIADHGRTIRLPADKVQQTNKMNRVTQQLVQKHGKEPTQKQIAAAMGISVSKLRNLIKISQNSISLETPAGDDETLTLESLIGAHNADLDAMLDNASNQALADEAKRILSNKWKEAPERLGRNMRIFDLRILPLLDLGAGETLENIGKTNGGITKERVRQIERECLNACVRAAGLLKVEVPIPIKKALEKSETMGGAGETLRIIYERFGFDEFGKASLDILCQPLTRSSVSRMIKFLKRLGVIMPAEEGYGATYRLSETLQGPTKQDTQNNVAALYNIEMKTGSRRNVHPLSYHIRPENEIPALRERVKIELLHRNSEHAKKTDLQKEPYLIKAWNGYASPGFQQGLLTRIRRLSHASPHQVDFREKNVKKLVDFAIANKKDEHIVTILPFSKLSETQIKRLTEEKARVVFMDFENEELTNETVCHIEGIIAAGIAYLNNNDLAFMNIYRLLTDDNRHDPVTVEEFKKDPAMLKFLLKPVEIKNAEELRHLHERIEELLVAA